MRHLTLSAVGCRAMPTKPLGPCRVPGCPGRATHKGRCHDHFRADRRAYDQRRGSSNSRGYDRGWRAKSKEYLASHPYCAHCGGAATEVDHILTLYEGGTNDAHNLQALCRSCHSRKTRIDQQRTGRNGHG